MHAWQSVHVSCSDCGMHFNRFTGEPTGERTRVVVALGLVVIVGIILVMAYYTFPGSP